VHDAFGGCAARGGDLHDCDTDCEEEEGESSAALHVALKIYGLAIRISIPSTGQSCILDTEFAERRCPTLRPYPSPSSRYYGSSFRNIHHRECQVPQLGHAFERK
jgi:hypothetical protein